MREAQEASGTLRGGERGPFLGYAEIGECSLSRQSSRRASERNRAHRTRTHGHALDAGYAGRQNVEFETLVGEPLSRPRNAAQCLDQQSANRLGTTPHRQAELLAELGGRRAAL